MDLEMIFASETKKPLIGKHDDVLIMKSLHNLERMKFNEIREF